MPRQYAQVGKLASETERMEGMAVELTGNKQFLELTFIFAYLLLIEIPS